MLLFWLSADALIDRLLSQRYLSLGNGTSDLFKLIALLGAYDYEGSNPNFCTKSFVRAKVSSFALQFDGISSIVSFSP